MLENTVDEVNFAGKLWDQRSNMNTRRSSRMGKRFCSKCFLDSKLFCPPQVVGTLSQDEWEALTIYTVFAFKKIR